MQQTFNDAVFNQDGSRIKSNLRQNIFTKTNASFTSLCLGVIII